MYARLYLLSALVLVARWGPVVANTEIVNFVVDHTDEMVVVRRTADWPILQYRQNRGRWNVQPAPLNAVLQDVCEPGASTTGEPHASSACPHELWVVLELNDDMWRSFKKFTLRLSWPAFYPTEFLIQLYDVHSLPSRFDLPSVAGGEGGTPPMTYPPRSKPRQMYARIRLVNTGVLTPSWGSANIDTIRAPEEVPFNLILEPLYFGVLPESVLPVVLFLVFVVILAGMMVPFINRYLEQVVRAARREMDWRRKIK